VPLEDSQPAMPEDLPEEKVMVPDIFEDKAS